MTTGKITKKEFSFRNFWKKLWFLLSPLHRSIFALLVLLAGMEMLRLLGPYILKIIIDNLVNFNPSLLPKIIILVGAMFLANQSVSLWNYQIDKKIFAAIANLIYYLATNAHKKLVFLTLGYHEKENTGNKILKISRGVDKIDMLFGNFFWEVAPTIIQIILTTITLFFIDWRFGMVVLLFVPVFIFLTLKVNKTVFPSRKARFDQEEEMAGIMAQSIININTVKSFVQEVREYKKFSQMSQKVKDSILFEFGKIIKYNLVRHFIIDLGRGSMIFLAIYLVWQGQISVGSLIFVFTISEKALISLFRISRLYDRIMESSEAVERLYDLEKADSDIKNPVAGIKPKKIIGEIEFRGVTFMYSQSKNKALDKVNFKIQSGCVTALVGPSGGGKTTVARLLYRHYDPAKGEIFLDEKNLKEYDLYSFRKFLAIVPQDVEVFNSSIRENISYAKPKASLAEIKAAARIANAEEFINNLSEGYETMVGERGIKLSGGQRQRIGIARAILANPQILIFDEATSNLDSHSEKLIQEALDRIRKGRTVIIIAHRLSTIKKADKIIVLEKGRVMEQGSHFELARVNGGLYQKLIKLQEMGEVG